MKGEYCVVFRRSDYYAVCVIAHDKEDAVEIAFDKLDADPDQYLLEDEEELMVNHVEDLEE